MGIVLFNKTTKAKELPKFRYNGKFILMPQKTYPIKDYMVNFYKPYERVGVVIQRVIDKEDEIEEEVKKIIEEEEVKEVAEEIKSSVVEETPSVEVFEEESEEDQVTEEVADENTIKKYTEAELDEIKIDEMKKILDDHGVDYSSFPNKRKVYIEAILKAQE